MNAADVFNQIESEHPTITGWCPQTKAFDLASLVLGLHPKVVVETGVWGGKSLLPMALAAKCAGGCKVIAIDPWNPAASTEGYTGENETWWGQQDHERVYQGFLTNLQRLGLTDIVEVRREKSEVSAVPDSIDLLHLDGQHSEVAVREAKRFVPAVRVGGVVILDDLEWQNAGVAHVAQVVTWLLANGFIELYRTKSEGGHWGVFERVAPHGATESLPPTLPLDLANDCL